MYFWIYVYCWGLYLVCILFVSLPNSSHLAIHYTTLVVLGLGASRCYLRLKRMNMRCIQDDAENYWSLNKISKMKELFSYKHLNEGNKYSLRSNRLSTRKEDLNYSYYRRIQAWGIGGWTRWYTPWGMMGIGKKNIRRLTKSFQLDYEF